jgi:ADP-ribosylglycohydrolase
MQEALPGPILGCVVGGAIGDAAGAPFEGAPGASATQAWREADWRLTDDTQLTLATCEAIIEVGAPEPEAIAASLLRWFRARRLVGLGASTLKALRDLHLGTHWALAGRRANGRPGTARPCGSRRWPSA